jgi:hypothetical protein
VTLTSKLHVLSLVLAGISVCATVAAAQTPRAMRPDRARTFLVLRLTEALDLSDEKALQVGRILRETDARRRALRDRRAEVEAKLRGALMSNDQSALTKLIADTNQLDEELAMVPEHGFREVQKVVTLEQQAKLVIFRQELQKEVRSAMRRRMGDRGVSRRRMEN